MAGALVVALSLAACTASSSDDGTTGTGDGESANADDDLDPTEPNGDAPREEDREDQDPSGPSGRIGFFGPPQVHPQRVLAGVTGISVDEAGNILVDLEVWNRKDRQIWVAQRGALRLEDDLGNTYEAVEPDGGFNTLRMHNNQRAEITLAFGGPVDPDATRLTLGLNARDGFHEPAREDDSAPRFTFADLPLPAVGLDGEGVGDGPAGLDLRPASVDIDGHGVESDDVGLVGVIEIRRVTVGPLSMEVDVYLRNDGDRPAELARQIQIVPERDGEPLPDYRFEYVRSVADEEYWSGLEVQPGEEMEATLMFRAAIPHDADTFRIGFNQVRNEWLVRGEELPAMASQPTASLYGIPLPDRTDGED